MTIKKKTGRGVEVNLGRNYRHAVYTIEFVCAKVIIAPSNKRSEVLTNHECLFSKRR